MRSCTPAPRLVALLLSAFAFASLGAGKNVPAPHTRPPSLEVTPPQLFHDCNANGVEDAVDIALGTSSDVDLDGVPDECQSCEGGTGDAGGGGTPRSGHES